MKRNIEQKCDKYFRYELYISDKLMRKKYHTCDFLLKPEKTLGESWDLRTQGNAALNRPEFHYCSK